jgi:hypothetical protein
MLRCAQVNAITQPPLTVGRGAKPRILRCAQVVDPRRAAREAMAAALLRALPALRDASCAAPRAFRPLRLTFDSAAPFQAVRGPPCILRA